jgi:hypothetical protein
VPIKIFYLFTLWGEPRGAHASSIPGVTVTPSFEKLEGFVDCRFEDPPPIDPAHGSVFLKVVPLFCISKYVQRCYWKNDYI